MKQHNQKTKFLGLLFLTMTLIVTLSLTTQHGLANAQNKTLMQPTGIKGVATNITNIILVHGFWGDGSSWSKVIPILQNSGHKVIAVQLPLHSLADDVATTKRAIDHIGGPVILVGHSYGGAAACRSDHEQDFVQVEPAADNVAEPLSQDVSGIWLIWP